ncbi:ABC-type transport auxiliary lipoprotein family protein [Altererythrobacter sp. H2]|uniref:ABC-type transport auxiliary lipoprotein family protein n=1 Tax=Altererythrobacter sp. H2 TaxID=3108391 RepID=UPI000BCC8542|nr:ABC-type transport auxiliary lipoprotein family protein [Altererythrobacter sp. H2]OZA93940.1 MAG: ABC transporter [Erythrobacter sp. 34-65-8]WRK95523.1 ABC-type transport auxiliary lipoprotein family protein [Altererythrobacter sp. H2]
MARISKAVLAGGLAMALAGCISLGSEPPPSLLSLTATAMAPAGSATSGDPASAIAILEPGAPQSLDVARVPVQIDDTEIAYLKDAVWVEKPARLFQRLLAETVRARTGRLVTDGETPAIGAVTRIEGSLGAFGYDARTSSVVVRYDAVRAGAGDSVQTRRFEAVVPGVAAEAGPVGRALNEAANQVAGEVAAWVSGG